MNPYMQNDLLLNSNHMNNFNSNQMNNFNSILQLHIMRNLTTGNWIYDIMIQTLLITMVGFVITRIKTMFDNIGRLVGYFFDNIFQHIKNLYRYISGKKLKVKKTVEIPYITSTKQINELYKAINWYLINNKEINLDELTYLQYSFDKKIVTENFNSIKKNTEISKIPTSSESNIVKFKGYEISYKMATSTVTIYTDTEKKKENYIIYLSIEVDNTVKTDILEEFCQHCVHRYIDSLTEHRWEQKIYINKNNKWDAQNSNNTRKLETIILKDGLKETIKEDIDLFLNSKDWYMDRDIPYSRGYLFYGLPGTGKTSMIKALSLYCRRHIHFLMLSKVKDDSELLELLKQINYTQTILVIEDIDATIESVKSRLNIQNKEKEKENTLRNRKNKSNKKDESESEDDNDCNNNDKSKKDKNKSGVTLSGLLNAIDGVFDSTGRILIMTTNHPEVLDDALIRPGRIDSKYLFDNCDHSQIERLYEMFFNQIPDKTILNSFEKVSYSPAHITSVFMRFRNEPEKALKNLDNEYDTIKIKSLYDENMNSKTKQNGFMNMPNMNMPNMNMPNMNMPNMSMPNMSMPNMNIPNMNMPNMNMPNMNMPNMNMFEINQIEQMSDMNHMNMPNMNMSNMNMFEINQIEPISDIKDKIN